MRAVRRLARRSEFAWRLRDRRARHPAGITPEPGSLRPVVHPPNWLRWDHMPQRPHAILTAFARAGHPVAFVAGGARPTVTDDGVVVARDLRAVPSSGVIVYTHFAPMRRLIERFDDAAVIYDVLDDLAIYAAGERGLPPGRRVADHHEQLVQEADVVVASSEVLAEQLRPLRDDVLVVPNGVDVRRFLGDEPRPADVPPGPVIGFIGAVARWVDFSLLGGIAAARPDWHLVFVGPIDADVDDRAAQLASRPNVTFLGMRAADEIPSYAAAFDVGIVPFVTDRITEAVSPLKMYEYLAAGRGVVAAPMPACRGIAEVEIADGVAEFVAAIERRLHLDGRAVAERARAVAAAATWERRLSPVLERLDSMSLRRVAG